VTFGERPDPPVLGPSIPPPLPTLVVERVHTSKQSELDRRSRSQELVPEHALDHAEVLEGTLARHRDPVGTIDREARASWHVVGQPRVGVGDRGLLLLKERVLQCILLLLLLLGPGRHCLPRHKTSFHSIKEGPKCVSGVDDVAGNI